MTDIEKELEALKTKEKTLDKNDLDLAESYLKIGDLYLNNGKPKTAADYYLKGRSIIGNYNDLDVRYAGVSCKIADAHFILGYDYSIKNDIENALEQYNIAYGMYERYAGKLHPDFLTACCNLGSVYYKGGYYEAALEHHLEAYEIQKANSGFPDEDVAFYSNKAAMDYEALGDKEKALEYYKEALANYSALEECEEEAETVRQSIKRIEAEIL